MMFEALSPWTNAAVFAVAAALVWFAATRVARCVDAIERRTGMGEAIAGMLLLGLIGTLPEVAVSVTAAHAGDAKLAVNNVLGSMALNVAILAAADVAVRREALTSTVGSALPLLQAALLVLMLAVAAAATVAGDRAVLGVGVWSWLLLAIYAVGVVLIRSTRGHEAWVPSTAPRTRGRPKGAYGTEHGGAFAPVIARTGAGAAAILVAGYALARSGEALAAQTGLGSSFFGAVFLALSTSLPEMTIVFSAVRLGSYAMAVSDIFGANLFGLTLLFVIDAVDQGAPALAHASRFATFAALLAIAVTTLFIAGLLERRHAMVLRMGVDSITVIATYAAGVVVLYALR